MSVSLNAIQILTECGSCLKSGCLTIQAKDVQWKIFFHKGELQYADCSAKDLSLLQYFFVKKGWDNALQILKKMPNDSNESKTSGAKVENEFNQALAWLRLHKGLDAEQLKQLVKDLSLDALESFLWLKDGVTHWQDRESLPSWIQASLTEKTSLDLGQTIKYLHQRLKEWHATSQLLDSPHQRPYILDFRDIEKPIPNGTLSSEALGQLAGLLRRGLSVRQLSLYLQRDEIQVAKILAPYIEGKVIHLRPPNPPFNQLPSILREAQFILEKPKKSAIKAPKIACIDDSPTMLSEIKRFLNSERYEVTTIEDPVKASSILFKLKPDLILLDITMPKINGYSLCSLLRNSAVFDSTPIIMVSGNTGLIDKARAKICGATGYLSKPFTQRDLLDITEKYLTAA